MDCAIHIKKLETYIEDIKENSKKILKENTILHCKLNQEKGKTVILDEIAPIIDNIEKDVKEIKRNMHRNTNRFCC